MIYRQGHLIPQSLSTSVTFCSHLQNLPEFGETFLLLLPADMLLEPAVSKVMKHPTKVSKPHPKSLFPKHKDKDRSQQGWRTVRGGTKLFCSGKVAGKEEMISNCPVLSALWKSKTIPKSATQTLISFPGLNTTSQTSPMPHCSLPNVLVPFTFSCLWKKFNVAL